MDALSLPVLILEYITEAAVQHAGLALGQACGVLAGLQPTPAGFGPDQLDLGILDEREEDSRSVRSPAHAGHNRVGQAVELLETLLPGFASDHRLEVAHDHGKGMRADHAAN